MKVAISVFTSTRGGKHPEPLESVIIEAETIDDLYMTCEGIEDTLFTDIRIKDVDIALSEMGEGEYSGVTTFKKLKAYKKKNGNFVVEKLGYYQRAILSLK